MAFRESIKNINSISGFAIGFLLTFGRAYFPIIEKLFRPVFNLWISVWPMGILLEITPLYITGLIIFLVLRFLAFKHENPLGRALMLFSFGFILSFALFLVLTLVAVSQFQLNF